MYSTSSCIPLPFSFPFSRVSILLPFVFIAVRFFHSFFSIDRWATMACTILSERNINQGSGLLPNRGLAVWPDQCQSDILPCMSLPHFVFLVMWFCFCAWRRTNRQTNRGGYALHSLHCTVPGSSSRSPNHFLISIYLSFIISFSPFLLFLFFSCSISFLCSFSSLCSMYHLAVFCCLPPKVS